MRLVSQAPQAPQVNQAGPVTRAHLAIQAPARRMKLRKSLTLKQKKGRWNR